MTTPPELPAARLRLDLWSELQSGRGSVRLTLCQVPGTEHQSDTEELMCFEPGPFTALDELHSTLSYVEHIAQAVLRWM